MIKTHRTRLSSYFTSRSTESSMLNKCPKIESSANRIRTQSNIKLDHQVDHVSMKQSSKLIMNSVIDEFRYFLKAIGYTPSKDLELQTYIQLLVTKFGCRYTELEPVLQAIKNRCNNESMQIMNFIFSVIEESYGHINIALRYLKTLLGTLNHNKQYRSKLVIYFRLGQMHLREQKMNLVLNIGRKLLKWSWFTKSTQYELKAYELLSKALQQTNFKASIVLRNRFYDGILQQNDDVKQIGLNQLLNSMKSTNKNRDRSPSIDEFDEQLLVDQNLRIQEFATTYIGGKTRIKLSEKGCQLCQLFVNNERIQTQDCQPYRKDQVFSTNRDYIKIFNSDAIECVYKPSQTLPIVKKLLLILYEII